MNESILQNEIKFNRDESPFFRSLIPLLDAMGWQGSKNVVFEALPFDSKEKFNLESLISTLANLQFRSDIVESSLEIVNEKNTPCIFIKESDKVYVILKTLSDGFLVYDAFKSEYVQLEKNDSCKGKFIFISRDTVKDTTANDRQDNWFSNILQKFYPLFGIVIVITLVITCLTLLQPTFVTTLFGQIFPGASYMPLIWLAIGVIIYLAAMEIVTSIRFDIMNYISARIGYIIDNQIIRRILYLPLSFTEKASISSQISRIKDFQSIQKFKSGRGAISLFDLPFLVILIGALFVIGGFLGFVPIVGIVVFIIFGFIMNGFVTRINSSTSKISTKRQELTLEILNNIEAIKDSNSEDIWLDRYIEFSSKTIKTSLESERLNTFINNFSSMIVSLSGLATIIIGASMVIEGQMTSGGLIAAMLLTWRILNPVKSSFSTMTQLYKLTKSIAQVDKLMSLNFESNPVSSISLEKPFEGKIAFNQVSLRYQPDRDPALVGVSFSINPNEILVIRGYEGAGKSTVLKLINGLYSPQAGNVLIDDFNIKQITPILLRKSLALLPQSSDIFNGTISSNLRMGSLEAKNADLIEVTKLVGIYDEIMELEKGFETVMDRRFLKNYKESFLRKLCFARTLLRKSNIVLLDEVDTFFSDTECSNFIETLKILKKTKTVVLTSNNKNLIPVSDKVMELASGKVTFFDKSNKFK